MIISYAKKGKDSKEILEAVVDSQPRTHTHKQSMNKKEPRMQLQTEQTLPGQVHNHCDRRPYI
jgi:hypothetical protein